MRVLYCGYNLSHQGYESMSNHVSNLLPHINGEVITLQNLKTKKPVIKKDKIIIINNRAPWKYFKLAKIFFISKINSQKNIDLIHVISFGPAMYIKHIKKKFIISFSEGILFNRENKIIKQKFLKMLKTKPKYIICESQRMKEYFLNEKIPSQKLIVISPGVDLKHFKQKKQRKYNNEFKILFASAPLREGHFYTRGIDLLKKSFEKFSSKHNSELNFIWRAYGKRKIEFMCKKTKGKIKIIDKKIKNMNELYPKFDVTIIPYRNVKGNKDIPTSAIESLACGTPVIAPKYSALNSFGIKNGIVFHDGTINGIYNSLVKLKKNYTEHSKNARKIAEKYFDFNEELKKLNKIYKQAIE